MHNKRHTLAGSLFLAALSAVPAHAVVVGEPVPACDLGAVGDAPATRLDALRGRVVYVDFWASWCPPCAKSFPKLDALRAEFAPRGFEVLGVNVDQNAADAAAFLARRPVRFALARDAGGACPRAFGVKAMPSGYLIDRHGVVREVFAGFRDADAARLRSAVARLLDEAGPARIPDAPAP